MSAASALLPLSDLRHIAIVGTPSTQHPLYDVGRAFVANLEKRCSPSAPAGDDNDAAGAVDGLDTPPLHMGIPVASFDYCFNEARNDTFLPSITANFVFGCPAHREMDPSAQSLLRVCDGAIIMVDAAKEAACGGSDAPFPTSCGAHTETCIRSCIANRVKPIVAIDNLEMLLFPAAANALIPSAEAVFLRLKRIVDNINIVVASYTDHTIVGSASTTRKVPKPKTAAALTLDDIYISDEDDNDDAHPTSAGAEQCLQLSPVDGSLQLCSTKGGWSFSILEFARRYAKKFKVDESKLRRRLWGNWYYDQEHKLWTNQSVSKTGKPLKRAFCQFVLEPIYQIRDAVTSRNEEQLHKIMKALEIDDIPGAEQQLRASSSPTTPSERIAAILARFVPLEDAVFGAVARHLPSPLEVQAKRAEVIFREKNSEGPTLAAHRFDTSGALLVHLVRTISLADQPGQRTLHLAFGRVFGGIVRSGIKVSSAYFQRDEMGSFYNKRGRTISCDLDVSGVEPISSSPSDRAQRRGTAPTKKRSSLQVRRHINTADITTDASPAVVGAGELVVLRGSKMDCAADGAATLFALPVISTTSFGWGSSSSSSPSEVTKRNEVIHRPLFVPRTLLQQLVHIKVEEPKATPDILKAGREVMRMVPYPMSVLCDVTHYNDIPRFTAACVEDVEHAVQCFTDIIQKKTGDAAAPSVELGPLEAVLNESVAGRTSKAIVSKSTNKGSRLYGAASPMYNQPHLRDDASSQYPGAPFNDHWNFIGDLEAGAFRPDLIEEHVPTNSRSRAKLIFNEYGWDPASARRMFMFGPDKSGPNVLINGARGPEKAEDFNERDYGFRESMDNIERGFHWFCSAGALGIDAPLRGVCVGISKTSFHADALRRGAAQVIPMTRRLCMGAVLLAQPILLEPLYSMEVVVPARNAGDVYATLNTKRGTITAADNLFSFYDERHEDVDEILAAAPMCIRGFLPASEVAGFSAQLKQRILAKKEDSNTSPTCNEEDDEETAIVVDVSFSALNEWIRLRGDVLEPGSYANGVAMKRLAQLQPDAGKELKLTKWEDIVQVVPDADNPPGSRW